MPSFHVQNVLNGGEISPLMRGRVDQPRYSTGTREMLNFVPMPQGGVTRRPGTRYLGAACHEKARLVPFVFSATQGRMLEFGDHVMRVWLPDGSLVTKDGTIMTVEAPFAVEDLADLRFAQSADVIYFAHPSYAPCKVSRYADDDWRFSTLTFMPAIYAPGTPSLSILDKRAGDDKPASPSKTDYSYLVTAIDENGVESKPSEAAAIEAEDLNSVDYHIRISWTAVEGAVSYRIYNKKQGVFGFIGRTEHGETTGGTISGIRMGALTSGVLRYAGSITRNVDTGHDESYPGEGDARPSSDATSALSVYAAEQNAFLLGGKLFVRVTKTTNTTSWIFNDNDPDHPGKWESRHTTTTEAFWAMADCSSDNPAGSYAACETGDLGTDARAPSGSIGPYRIEMVYSGASLYYDDKNIGADIEDTPPEYENPFEGEGNYPTQVFFHQQRLGYAATTNRPITVWLSRSGEFESFASSTPPKDDDAIEVTLAATQANRIVWLQPDRTSLAFGTEGSEWLLTPSEGVALTPSTVSFQLQTTSGGSDAVPAVSLNGSIVYVQRGSGAVREFAYSYSADKYLSQDLTILARHVVRDVDIVSWAFQQEPYSVLWCVLSDGTMAALTYMKEQEVIGWHRHETDGNFLDAASMPGVPDDQLWFLVRREGGVFVERMDGFFDADDLAEAYFLDSALNYQGEPVTHFSGLSHLAGRQVQVFADGGTIDGLFVSAQGELALEAPASSVHVGLPYVSRLVPNLPEVEGQQGTSFLHNRKISAVRLRVYRSMSFMAGLDDALVPVVDRHVRSGAFSTRPFFSEGTDLSLDVCGGWADASPLVIEVSSATPLTILALLTAVDVSPYSGKGGF